MTIIHDVRVCDCRICVEARALSDSRAKISSSMSED
jgi:hypothetical protein